ncbi:MAG: hypothetical protein ACI9KE_004417 [Polyangiales bacterium]|jgi:hypothetical protein
MKYAILVMVLSLGGVACGDDGFPPSGGSPDASDRELNAFGEPLYEAPMPAGFGDLDLPEPEPVPEPGPCCEVEFALTDESDAEEASGVLRGADEPLLGEGVALVYEDGAWRATVCMPQSYQGTYYYEFALRNEVEDAGVDASVDAAVDAGVGPIVDAGSPVPFLVTRVNRLAPSVADGIIGIANFFTAVTACEDVDDTHGATE